MKYLIKSLQAWGSEEFESIFKREALALGVERLPLLQAMQYGNHILEDSIKLMVNASSSSSDGLIVRVGVFFDSVIGGCNCADDPTPLNTCSEYCELQFMIDASSGKFCIDILE